jgi:hypothetical protein
MDFKRISGQAKKLIDQRGGTEALKGDLEELKTIAKGKGSLGEKAKAAGAALKDPGQRTASEPETSPPVPPATPPPAS